MAQVTFKLEGAEKMARDFLALEKDMRKKILRTALRNSAKRIRAQVADNTPVRTGALQRAMKSAKIRGKVDSKGVRFGIAMPTREELGIPPEAKGYYPFALEYGAQTSKGKIPAHLFIRGTVDLNAQSELSQIGSEFGRRIEREAKRRAKRAGVRL